MIFKLLTLISAAALSLCLMTASGADAPEPHATEPPAPVVTTPGAYLQRTMTLLATSTPRHRHAVRILFYGQSITKQEWSQAVAEDLHRRFPDADLTVENRAIGGFASNLLIRTVDRDVDTFSPDLVIFHDYGGEPDYEEIIARIRRRTAAEIALCNDHMTEGQPNEWHDHHSNVWMPQIAAKYGCEFVDIRTPWKQYLQDHALRPNALLKDGVHLNDQGNALMASLVEPHLRYDPALPLAATHPTVTQPTVRTYRIGTDLHWSHGTLTLPFDGNRVDVIAAAPNAGKSRGMKRAGEKDKSGGMEVWIDGKRPSEFPGLYSYTRPGDQPGKDWPWDTGGILQINAEASPLLEEWTVRITDTNSDASLFHFTVTGSKTGRDGAGASDQRFVSQSRRVIIDPKDWWVKGLHDVVLISPGTEIKWHVLPLFCDHYQPPVVSDPTREYTTTLAQCLTNGRHQLTLVAGKNAASLQAIRVYRSFIPPSEAGTGQSE